MSALIAVLEEEKWLLARGVFSFPCLPRNQLWRQVLALCWATMSVQLAALPYRWSVSQQKPYLLILDIYNHLTEEKQIRSSYNLRVLTGENSMKMTRKCFCCLAPLHSGTPVCVHLASEMSYWNKLCISSALLVQGPKGGRAEWISRGVIADAEVQNLKPISQSFFTQV